VTKYEVIAIYGKTLRGSHNKHIERGVIEIVRIFTIENHLVLGQVKVYKKKQIEISMDKVSYQKA